MSFTYKGEEYLTTKEAADFIGFSPKTLGVWRWLKRKNTPKYVKITNRIYYPKKELEKWLENQLQIEDTVSTEPASV